MPFSSVRTRISHDFALLYVSRDVWFLAIFFRCGFVPDAVCTVRVDIKLALWLGLALVWPGVWSVFKSSPPIHKSSNKSPSFVFRLHKRSRRLKLLVGIVLECRFFCSTILRSALGAAGTLGKNSIALFPPPFAIIVIVSPLVAPFFVEQWNYVSS